ncbi:MAG: cytochrome bc complex cytochrome b subunit [Thermoguttaceae bacterium]
MSRASSEIASGNRGWLGRLGEFFYQRLGLDSAAALAAKKHVPVHRTTFFYFLGGMALFLFGVQVATGILLSLYYKPSPDQAFESVRAIMTEVDFGWLFRSIHSWSANLLIGILFLHLLTTYMMRAYRRPRELTWMTGVVLLGVFLAFGFSGYLLPWNQLSFFATRVGTAIAGAVPGIGKYALLMARGGEEITGDTLARFYALHVVILPLATIGLIGLHLFLVQKHEISIPEGAIREHGGVDKVPHMPFVPHFLLHDMVGWYLALGILAALAALFPWELGQKADPFGSAPAGIKPEWYFLFMFQALKQLPANLWGIEWLEGDMVGVLFFGFCGAVVFLVPYLDADVTRERSRRLLTLLTALLAAFLAAVVFWFLCNAAGALVVYRFTDPSQARDLDREASVAWWLQYVAYPACCGAAMILIALATFGRPRRQPRLNVNLMAALAVLFFIVMTAWGLAK